VNNIIGSSNYDIGHVFSTGGGGIAGWGVVCSSSQKARGVTGSPSPQGDAFDIDYVAHEMGHQFRGSHSYNNSCSGNRSNSTSYEPGSGSSIMGYAGICSPNVQGNSDVLFHGISLEEIGSFITSSGDVCGTDTPLSNNPPSITGTNIDGNVSIPANTPFALTMTATDPDGDALTYTWEQFDKQITPQPPQANSTTGPNFRSFNPSTSPTRHIPELLKVSLGIPTTWEVLSNVSRVFNFRATVRDNAIGGGCNDHTDVSLNVDGNSGPFVVTAPNNPGGWWTVGQPAQVTWDIAGTDLSPVNCDKVDIFLSVNNGSSYPIQLANDVPNQGQWTVIAPNNVTIVARVMVISSNGTFFDVSDNNFKIQAATGINDLSANQSVLSFYNNQKIELSLSDVETGNYNVDVVNALGQKVVSKEIRVESRNEKFSIPFNNTSNGIYYISISNEKAKYNAKFFKN
ncbi:MAG: reprolysin-like metallopeptidase, partial [Vicingaceae bacterium]